MLSLNINRKEYICSPLVWLQFTSVTVKGQIQDNSRSLIGENCQCRYQLQLSSRTPRSMDLLFSSWFLALLDYVSRAYEIEIRSSVIRPWHQLSLNLLHEFLSNFDSCFPWAICPDFLFCNFWKKKDFYEYVSFSLTWDPMEAKTSKRYFSLKSLLHPFTLFPNFLLSGPRQK